jgi:hypothetical protein
MQEIYQIISQSGRFFNPFQIISGAVLVGLLALVLTFVLLILFRKQILIPRSHKALKVLAYAYFALLPLLAGFFWMKWGFFNSLRKDIKAHTDVYIQHLPATFDAETAAALKSYLDNNKVISASSSNDLIDAAVDIIYTGYNRSLDNQLTLKESNGVLKAWLFRITRGPQIAGFLKKTIRDILHEKLHLNEDVSKELMNARIDDILRTGLFAKITLIQTDLFLKGIQKSILLLFFSLLLIPLAEIGIAHRIYRRQKKNTPLPLIP